MTDLLTDLTLATDALDKAREDILATLPKDVTLDRDAELVLRARATDAAAFGLATQYGSLVKSILYLMFQMELYQYYRFLDQEYESLREWVKFRFAKLFESGALSEDYIMRYCKTVEAMLIPQHHAYLTGQSKVSPESLIQNASEAQLKETPHLYQSAAPDMRETLVETLAEPTKDIGERREKRAKLEIVTSSIREKSGLAPMTLYAETTPNGMYEVHGTLTHEELMFLMSVLGRRVDVHFAGAA